MQSSQVPAGPCYILSAWVVPQPLQDSRWLQQALAAQLQCLWLPPSSGLNLPGEATLRHCGHPVTQPSSHLLKSQSILPWPDAKAQDRRPRQPLNHIILSGYLSTASRRNPQARNIRDIYGLLTQSHHSFFLDLNFLGGQVGDPRLPLPFEPESENPRIPGGLEEGVLPLSPGPVSSLPHPSQPLPILRSFINLLWAAWMAGSTLRGWELTSGPRVQPCLL